MGDKPLVSILTPTYNHEKYIGQCIESVLAQTYPYWEQIIIDDGSTDRTREIAAQYRDRRIKYIRQDHVGVWRFAETYNKALQLSEGQLIAMLDGDDFWPNYKLERQVPVFRREEVVLSFGMAGITNSEGKINRTIPEKLRWFNNSKNRKEEILRKLFSYNFIPACTVMCRKDALLAVGGFQQPDHTPFIDYPTWLEVSLIGELYYADALLGFFRTHQNQTSAVLSRETREAHNRCTIAFWERLPQPKKLTLGTTFQELLRECRNGSALMHFSLGRWELFRHEWLEARKDFAQAWREGKYSTKLRALLGMACSYLKVDLEWIAAILHRPRLIQFH